MKKFFAAVLCAAMITLIASGCGAQDALDAASATNTDSATADSADKEETKKVNASDYSDNLDGLCKYFNDLGYIENKDDKTTEMDASLIGAEKGKKFAATYNGKSVTVELYEYNPDKLNDTANEVISSVKQDGTFTILELKPVKAYLSDNGKFLMIYTDSSIDDEKPDEESENYTHREEVIKNFKVF